MSKVDGLIVPLMVVVSSVRLACNVLLCVLDEPYSKTYLIDFHHFHRAFFLLFVRQYVFLKIFTSQYYPFSTNHPTGLPHLSIVLWLRVISVLLFLFRNGQVYLEYSGYLWKGYQNSQNVLS